MTTPEHVTAQTLADLHCANLALPPHSPDSPTCVRATPKSQAEATQPWPTLGDPNTTFATLDRARDDRRHLDRLIIRIAADVPRPPDRRALRHQLGRHPPAPTAPADATDANGDPLWANCITTGWCNPIANRYKTGRLCRFCGDRLALEGEIPTERMIRLHAQGKLGWSHSATAPKAPS